MSRAVEIGELKKSGGWLETIIFTMMSGIRVIIYEQGLGDKNIPTLYKCTEGWNNNEIPHQNYLVLVFTSKKTIDGNNNQYNAVKRKINFPELVKKFEEKYLVPSINKHRIQADNKINNEANKSETNDIKEKNLKNKKEEKDMKSNKNKTRGNNKIQNRKKAKRKEKTTSYRIRTRIRKS